MEMKKEWKITYHLRNIDLHYFVTNFKKREQRILFIDRKTGLHKDLPISMVSIEEVRQ